MKAFKDFINISKTIVQQKFCNHVNLESSSCPFTGRTYTDCLKCFKRLSVEVTK